MNETPGFPRLIVSSLSLSTTIGALGMSVAAVTLPELATALQIPMASTQWVTLAFLMSSTLIAVIAGRLADAHGRARILTVGLALFLGASVLASLAPNLWLLVAARVLQGAGAAALTTIPVSLIRESVPKERIGSAMGLIGSSMAAGMSLGPALGGLLVSASGWRSVFIFLAGLALIALILVIRVLPSLAGAGTSVPLSASASALLLIALSSFAIAMTLRPGGWIGTVPLILIAVAAMWWFIRTQQSAPHPLVDFAYLSEHRLWGFIATTFLGGAIMMTFTVVTPFYLIEALGLSHRAMGLSMAIAPGVAIVAGFFAGKLVDRYGATRMTHIGLAFMAVATLGFITLSPLIGLVGFILASLLLTPGNQLLMASINTSAMMRAGKEAQGAVSGMLNFARNIGFITGTGSIAFIYDWITREGVTASTTTAAMQVTFGIATMLGLLALFITYRSERNIPQLQTQG